MSSKVVVINLITVASILLRHDKKRYQQNNIVYITVSYVLSQYVKYIKILRTIILMLSLVLWRTHSNYFGKEMRFSNYKKKHIIIYIKSKLRTKKLT